MFDFKKNIESHEEWDRYEKLSRGKNYNDFIKKFRDIFIEHEQDHFSSNDALLALRQFIEEATLMEDYLSVIARKSNLLSSYKILHEESLK